MNFIGLKREEILNKNIIKLKTINDCIDLKHLILHENKHINKNVNNNTNTNIDIYNDIEVLIIEILPSNNKDINVEKIPSNNNNNQCIYFISFFANLIITYNLNSNVSQKHYKLHIAESFLYENIEYNFYIYPINISCEKTNSKIYLSITYAYLDQEKLSESYKYTKYTLRDEIKEECKDLQYIDINKEFL